MENQDNFKDLEDYLQSEAPKRENILTAYISMWKHIWVFDARTSRKTYWLALVSMFIINALAAIPDIVQFSAFGYGMYAVPVLYSYSRFTLIASLIHLPALTSVISRRLVDIAANPSFDQSQIITRGKIISISLYAFAILTAFFHGIILESLQILIGLFYIYIGLIPTRNHPDTKDLKYV